MNRLVKSVGAVILVLSFSAFMHEKQKIDQPEALKIARATPEVQALYAMDHGASIIAVW